MFRLFCNIICFSKKKFMIEENGNNNETFFFLVVFAFIYIFFSKCVDSFRCSLVFSFYLFIYFYSIFGDKKPKKKKRRRQDKL